MRQDTAPQLAILFDGTRAHAVYIYLSTEPDWQHQQVNRTAHPLFPVALGSQWPKASERGERRPEVYKWKNHFYEMKGDVGMSLH